MQRNFLAPLLLAAALAAGSWIPAAAQVIVPIGPSLHLIAATPTRNYNTNHETAIYRFDPQRKELVLVRSVGAKKVGSHFVVADYESRKMLVAFPRLVPTDLEIIDMASPGAVFRIPLNISALAGATVLWEAWSAHVEAMRLKAGVSTREFSFISQILFANPGAGHSLGLTIASNSGALLVAVPLDGGSRLDAVNSDSLSQLRVQGEFGVAGLGDSDMLSVKSRANKIFLDRMSKHIDLGIPAPDVPGAGAETNWRLLAHDGATTVLRRWKDPASSPAGDGASTLYVRNSSGRWAKFLVPGATPSVKMIGSWIIGAAASEALGRGSPGAENRRQRDPNVRETTEERPITDWYFKESGNYYPGVLFLIDSVTGRSYQIRTGSGDSEILLVDGTSVYYRVDNKLYVASINGDVIGPPQLLVQNDAIPDVHWAFIGS